MKHMATSSEAESRGAWHDRVEYCRSACARGETPVVDNINDAFLWGLDFTVCAEQQNPTLPFTLQDFANARHTMSTAYSGIGTPETANVMLSQSIRYMYPFID